MSKVMSFGNIVNSLRSVRDDYNEHLKTVPQYEAFLLVESSTLRVTDTLRSVVDSGAPSMAAEVIAALETARTKFRQHLTNVPEYRALLAIDKLISDVSADLGVRAEPQTRPQTGIEQAPVRADMMSRSALGEQPLVAMASELGMDDPMLDDEVMQAEAMAQAPLHDDAVAPDASAEQFSTDVLSAIEIALQQAADDQDILQHPGVAEQTPSEPAAASPQVKEHERYSLSQLGPGPFEAEAEKAA